VIVVHAVSVVCSRSRGLRFLNNPSTKTLRTVRARPSV
jgi:hypothetical protein